MGDCLVYHVPKMFPSWIHDPRRFVLVSSTFCPHGWCEMPAFSIFQKKGNWAAFKPLPRPFFICFRRGGGCDFHQHANGKGNMDRPSSPTPALPSPIFPARHSPSHPSFPPINPLCSPPPLTPTPVLSARGREGGVRHRTQRAGGVHRRDPPRRPNRGMNEGGAWEGNGWG